MENNNKPEFLFDKVNYKILLVGLAVIGLGFLLMSGGGSEDPNVFNGEELFSFRRIRLAPTVVLIGFGITTAASDAEKEAAYKFIEWWNTQDKDGSSPALEWSLKNGFPAYTYSVQNNDEYKANKKLSAMSAANPEAPTDFIVDSNFPGINAVLSDVIPEMINSVAFGNSSVEEALTKAQEATQKIVDKYNK